jgi:DNA-binding Xre family transcriptional regulator
MDMSVSYKKLWKLLIDNNMNKSDLAKNAKMSHNTIAKLEKNETVSLDILVLISEVFQCDIGDIVEVVNQVSKPISSEN